MTFLFNIIIFWFVIFSFFMCVKFNICKKAKNNKFILIGIAGIKQSGKDTVGKYLVNHYGFTRLAFADTLKEACKIIFGFSDAQVYSQELKEVEDDYWKHTPREILQKVGTELFRMRLPEICKNISDNIWIRSVERQIQNLYLKGISKFVITDIRFYNELNFVRLLGGVVWKISRPSLEKNQEHSFLLNPHSSEIEHSSETDILNFDIRMINILNDKTIDCLYKNIDNLINF